MSRPRHKITPLARLLIFMIIVLPIIYLLASYINGEDGIENIKNFFSEEQSTTEIIREKEDKILEYEMKIEDLREEIKALENQR